MVSTLQEGIEYKVTTTAGTDLVISFVHKRDGQVFDGVTNEDLLNVVLMRLESQFKVRPDRKTSRAISSARDALVSLEERNREKKRFNKRK